MHSHCFRWSPWGAFLDYHHHHLSEHHGYCLVYTIWPQRLELVILELKLVKAKLCSAVFINNLSAILLSCTLLKKAFYS